MVQWKTITLAKAWTIVLTKGTLVFLVHGPPEVESERSFTSLYYDRHNKKFYPVAGKQAPPKNIDTAFRLYCLKDSLVWNIK